MKQIKVKKLIFYILITILFIPLIQMNLNLIELNPLKGSFELAQKDSLKTETWFDGSFQKQYSKYINDSIGFRNTLVRLYNQIQFSLFNQTNANNVIIGKENYLFEGDYIDEYTGENFIGNDKIEENVKKIKNIQEYLKKNKDVDLIPIVLTGKASFYSEFIPDFYKAEKNSNTNYKFLISNLKKHNVNHIDLNKYFIDNKNKIQYPLYPKGGIHWTEYGVAFALDTIVKHIEKLRNINLIDFNYKNVETPDSLKNTDKDIEETMNLLFELTFNKMSYPILKYDSSKTHTKPRILMIGDSYCYSIMHTGILDRLFYYNNLWFYNRQIIPFKEGFTNKVKNLDLNKEFNNYDIILLMSTELNYYRFGFDFIEKAYSLINNIQYDGISEYIILKQIENIKNNPEWFTKIKQQAKERNISVDEMLKKNAAYFLKNKKPTNN